MEKCLFDDFMNITLLHQSLIAVIRGIDEKFCYACQELRGEPKGSFFITLLCFRGRGSFYPHRNITYLVFPPNSLLVDYAVA